jgi:hypothetical protein
LVADDGRTSKLLIFKMMSLQNLVKTLETSLEGCNIVYVPSQSFYLSLNWPNIEISNSATTVDNFWNTLQNIVSNRLEKEQRVEETLLEAKFLNTVVQTYDKLRPRMHPSVKNISI